MSKRSGESSGSQNDNIKAKVRKYMDSYLDMGFTFTDNKGIQQPLCVICGEVLSNQAMVPSKMMRHLETKHSNLQGKNRTYFEQLLSDHKKQSQMFSKVRLANDKAQEASFHVAKLVAKTMKPHTIVESLIMPACKLMVKTMLGDEAEGVISRMSSSNNTVQCRIEMMSGDIDDQLCKILRNRDFHCKSTNQQMLLGRPS
jgi:hypothetical protein